MNRGTNPKASQSTRAASLIIPDKMKTLNDATIPLRVPSALKDALQILAEKDERSLSSFIKRALEKVVADSTPSTPSTPAKVAKVAKVKKPSHVVTFKSNAKAKAKK